MKSIALTLMDANLNIINRRDFALTVEPDAGIVAGIVERFGFLTATLGPDNVDTIVGICGEFEAGVEVNTYRAAFAGENV